MRIKSEALKVLPNRDRPDPIETEIPLILQNFPTRIVWRNVTLFALLHAAAIFGLILFLSGRVMWQSVLWVWFLYSISQFGTTAGSHRLWSHKSYKAKLPLRILLAFFQTVAFQNCIFEWARDHRVHHKYSETNADPHNAKRGFFFAHIGWLLSRKHPALIQKGKGLDLSDLKADAVVAFQKRYYLPLMLLCCFVLPPIVPAYFWSESFQASIFFCTLFRYCFNLNVTWLVNSAAHLWGKRPYDKQIYPAQNIFVAIMSLGEGWHNYHHTFPWDYKTDELGLYRFNLTVAFLDFFAWVGWAYDLKTVPKEVVLARVQRTGDGSYETKQGGPWGWGDKDIPAENVVVTEITRKIQKP